MVNKRFGKRNLLVGLAAILVIVIVAVLAAFQKKEINPTLGELPADPTTAPITEATPEVSATDAPDVRAYLVVTVGGAMYEPIPLYESGFYTVRQGEDMINVIEVTPDSVRMRSSTCDNQDCVEQGVVSLENREKRVLRNMVICLPNQVTLELYTAEEIIQLMQSMSDDAGEAGHE